MKTKLVRILAIAPAFAVVLAAPNLFASETSARAEAAISEVKGDAAKAALKELDLEIDRLDAQLDHAPTPEEKAAAKARIAVLKERRNDLRKTYVGARYDELKADVRAEANRFGAWTNKTLNRDPASRAEREMRDTVRDVKRDANHAADSAVASMDLAAYKLRPTDTNKDEAKAALKALDARIEALDDRVDKMPRGADRDAAKRRVKALEDRKDELKGEFNKARFNALVDEVQTEWGTFVN
jgi:chromosome segregation ATPase